jgi:hypothetical protein
MLTSYRSLIGHFAMGLGAEVSTDVESVLDRPPCDFVEELVKELRPV